MTKRDFEEVAAILHTMHMDVTLHLHDDALLDFEIGFRRMLGRLCLMFQRRNPRFDAKRFYYACGVNHPGDRHA